MQYCEPELRARDQDTDCIAAGREGLSVLAGALKSLTHLTELKLTVGKKGLHAFEEGGEELFGAIAGPPALRILHMSLFGMMQTPHSPVVFGSQSARSDRAGGSEPARSHILPGGGKIAGECATEPARSHPPKDGCDGGASC